MSNLIIENNEIIIEVGQQGQPGVGLPSGGSTGQKLTKASDANYDTYWSDENAAKWGSITGNILDQTDLQTQFGTKQDLIVAGNVGEYYRWDKTFAPLNTAAVPESGNLYFTTPRVQAYIDTIAGIALGLATLDVTGKVPISQIPASIIGGVNYQGSWNALTNSPALASSVGTKGYYYVVSVAGTTNLNGITDWNLGDWAIFNGSIWEKIDNTDAVISVNGLIGAVVLTVANTGSALAWSAGQLQLPTATSSITGLLSNADWTTFNNKQAALGYTAANAALTLTAGAGLSGGGDLTANRSFAIDFASANTWSSVTKFSASIMIGGVTGINTTNIPNPIVQSLTGNGTANYLAARFSADNGNAKIFFAKSRNATFGGNTVVQTDDPLGTIEFWGADGTDYRRGAQILATVTDPTPSATAMGSSLRIFTTPAGSTTILERANFLSNGNVLIGGTSNVGGKLQITSTTEQFRLLYDSTNYNSFTVSSSGALTIASTGTNGGITLTPSGTGSVNTTAKLIIGNTTGTARLEVSGAISNTAWTTNGIQFAIVAASLTDSSSSGTVATQAVNAFGIPTLLASSATTYTNSANVYIAGAPVSSTNVTQTNAYALYVASGNTLLSGNLSSLGNIVVGNASALTLNSIAAKSQVLGTDSTAAANIVRYSNDATGGVLQIGKSRATTIGGSATVQTSDLYGIISWIGDNGTTFSEAARIQVDAGNTVTAPETPGQFRFFLTADGATTGTERMRLDSAGRLMLKDGAGSQSVGSVSARLQLGTTDSSGTAAIQRFSADANGNDIVFSKSRNGSLNSHTIVQSGDTLGGVTFYGSNGTTYDAAARIYSTVDGTPGASADMPGNLIFQTTPNGTATLATVLTLANNGDATHAGNVKLSVAGNALYVKQGTGGMFGRATLVSGTIAVTITGLTTNDVGFAVVITPGGTTGVSYKSVCSTDTLTITAVDVAGGTVVTDTSILGYLIVRPA